MHSLAEPHSKHTTYGSGGAFGSVLSGSLDCAYNPVQELDVTADLDISAQSQLASSLQPPASAASLTVAHVRMRQRLTLPGCSDGAHRRSLAAMRQQVLTQGNCQPLMWGMADIKIYQRASAQTSRPS